MQVLLNKTYTNLGLEGELVNVKPGFARNYLFPMGIAIIASPSSIAESEKTKKNRLIRLSQEKAEHQSKANAIMQGVIEFKVKVGENNKLYGSITNAQIAEKINAIFGLEINKKKVSLPEHIKEPGSYDVEVNLYPEVIAKVTVKVIGEEAEKEDSEQKAREGKKRKSKRKLDDFIVQTGMNIVEPVEEPIAKKVIEPQAEAETEPTPKKRKKIKQVEEEI